MIKAKKGLLITLFAAMMVFAFGATSVFAANAASWGDKYATVTDTDGVTFQTVRVFDSEGLITATPQDDNSVIGAPVAAPTTPAYFYDLEGSAFVAGTTAIDGKTFTQSAFQSTAASGLSIQLVEPSYVKDYDAKTAKKVPVAVTLTYNTTKQIYEGSAALKNNWTVYVESSKYESGIEADQTVTFKVAKVAPTAEVVPTVATTPDLTGTVAAATVTVKGLAKTPATADFYMDSTDSLWKTDAASSDYDLEAPYDGAAHTVVCDTVPGYTVSYQVYNGTTGKWDAVDAITITDKQASDIQAKAIFKKTGAADVTQYLYVNLFAAVTPAISFVEGDVDDAAIYNIEGDTYEAWDYVELIPYEFDIKSVSEAAKPYYRAYNAANEKATEANKDALMEAFKAYEEITAKAGKNTPNEITLKFEDLDLTSAQKTELATKYETLFRNFGMSDAIDLINTGTNWSTAYVNLNYSADYEVEFTDTPTAMKYKAKKLKKKAASFTVTAVCNNGATVAYKLIDAPAKITIDKKTGTITLAKGLKKGTYKIKVKAYVPGHSTVAFETQAIKIKVKK